MPVRLNHVLLTVLAAFSLLPILVLVLNSLKTTGEIAANPLALPVSFRYENYLNAWEAGRFATALPNTALLILLTVVGVWLVAGLAAFSLARLRPLGGNFVTMYLLVVVALPIQATVFVIFIMWSRVNLVDNLWGLVPLYVANSAPFSTVLLRSFMIAIPIDFEDAARVDGASTWQVFLRVILPLTWPGFLTVGLLAALNVWNEFFLAVTFIQTPEYKPISTSLYGFVSGGRFQDWGLANAAAVIMMLPVIVIFLLLQRHFIAGISQGGLK
jgi:raffinose/stachyose/melibiose transport system permease protein